MHSGAAMLDASKRKALDDGGGLERLDKAEVMGSDSKSCHKVRWRVQ